MTKKTSLSSRAKRDSLRKMLSKEVKVLSGKEWSGVVVGVVDEENLLILRNGEEVMVNIFDIRSK